MGKETDKRWKGIVIDWDEISQMDDADYELKPLNQQQVAILLALLQYQKWRTRWLNLDISNDELLAYIADIEYRLMMNEDASMVTKQELIDGICEGMQCYTESIAKRIISGVTTGIVIDDDGNVIVGGGDGSGAGLPTDDPATPYNDTKAAKYGAAVSVAKGIEQLWDTLDVLYGSTNGTPLTTLTDAQARIKMQFPCDGTQMDAAIDGYYTWRTSNNRIQFDTPALFPQTLYCKGVSEYGVQRYLAEGSGQTGTKLIIMSNLVTGLAQQFFDDFYEAGANVPSTAYLEAGCEPSPSETLNILLAGTTYTTNNSWKANHRLRLTVSGYFVDSSAPQKLSDFWWYSWPPAAPVNHVAGTNIQQGTGIGKPTVNQVPYASSHQYVFTMDTGSAGTMQITVPVAGMTAPYSSPTGGITVLIEDLGEYLG